MESLQGNLKREKQDLRNQMRIRRMELSRRYCAMADRQIFLNLKSVEAYQKSSVIFCYASLAEEVDTWRIISEALNEGKRVAIPRCREKGQMEAYEIKGFQDLEKGFQGILEPNPHCMLVKPEQLELCIIPCLSCSETGFRLGYGGGYYDRYLPKTSAFRVLLCREMLVCQDIPKEKHDCSMDQIITEKRVIFC